MKLQVALDDIELEKAVALVREIQNDIDIIEVGTPMIMEYGMSAVRRMKAEFPDKEVLADQKIMDAGFYESEEALKAGADYITVLGVTDDLTIKGCVEAAAVYHGQVVVDMICVKDLETRIREVEELGVDYVSVHVGVDAQAAGVTPLEQLKIMTQTATKANVSVAGGINVTTLPEYKALNPAAIIIGSGITHAENAAATAKQLHEIIAE